MKLVIENGALMGFDMEGEEIPEEVFDLRIPMGVVEIADEAFAADEGQSPYLGRVIIPDSVERIGKWAFFGQTMLETVHLGKSVSYLGGNTFAICPSLSYVSRLNDGMDITSGGNFSDTGLTEINAPAGLTVIDDNCFNSMPELYSIYIPRSVKCIKKEAFDHCPLLERIVYEGTGEEWNAIQRENGWDSKFNILLTPQRFDFKYEFLGDFEIEDVVLVKYLGKEKRVYIPDEADIIGSGAFSHNNDIEYVYLKYGVKEIGKGAFLSTPALKEVVLPRTLTLIDDMAFSGSGAERLVFNGTEEEFASIEKGNGWDSVLGKYTVEFLK